MMFEIFQFYIKFSKQLEKSRFLSKSSKISILVNFFKISIWTKLSNNWGCSHYVRKISIVYKFSNVFEKSRFQAGKFFEKISILVTIYK